MIKPRSFILEHGMNSSKFALLSPLRVRLDTVYFAENNKKNKKVTVHAFDTVHKPKITVHGQWTVPDARPRKKKKKRRKRKCHLIWIQTAPKCIRISLCIILANHDQNIESRFRLDQRVFICKVGIEWLHDLLV